jgi:hypothetical protein
MSSKDDALAFLGAAAALAPAVEALLRALTNGSPEAQERVRDILPKLSESGRLALELEAEERQP